MASDGSSPPPAPAPTSTSGRFTRAEVDLDIITDNTRALRAWARSPHFLGILKANAYGHGASAVANAVLAGGADRLGVYTAGEALELRQASIAAPIHVIGPLTPGETAEVADMGCILTITSPEAVSILTTLGRPVQVHIKVDTGLGRSGVSPHELGPVLDVLDRADSVNVTGLFTHFACADEAEKEPTRRQLELFEEAARLARSHGLTTLCLHTANTAATLDMPETHLDMVRCGIGLFGYYPSDQVRRNVSLRPALSLRSTVTRVHEQAPGSGVGYGYEFVCSRPTRIALVPIGYGDGLDRRLGNGRGAVLVQGQVAPIVGRVSMDQITLDVTDISGVRVGDSVTLIGRDGDRERSAEDLAREAGSISYAVLCALMPRVPRVYQHSFHAGNSEAM